MTRNIKQLFEVLMVHLKTILAFLALGPLHNYTNVNTTSYQFGKIIFFNKRKKQHGRRRRYFSYLYKFN